MNAAHAWRLGRGCREEEAPPHSGVCGNRFFPYFGCEPYAADRAAEDPGAEFREPGPQVHLVIPEEFPCLLMPEVL